MSIWDRVRYVWMNGDFVDWREATVHLSSPVVNMGLGVFEGIRAYWNPRIKQLNVFRLRDHLNRLFDSAKVHRMHVPFSKGDIEKAVVELLSSNNFREDIYIRPIIYRGNLWQEEESIDTAIYAGPRSTRLKGVDKGVRCCVSGWRRMSDSILPARVKACGNYLQYHYAMSEALASGFDNTILLTVSGKVSESPGANIFLIRDGVLITPSITSDILEGVTRDTLIRTIREELDLEVVEREVDRTELYVADEIFFCGTGGGEVTPVVSVDYIPLGKGEPREITERVRSLYLSLVLGEEEKYKDWLTPIYEG